MMLWRLVLGVLLGCATQNPPVEPTNVSVGAEESEPEPRLGPAEREPTRAIWELQTRYRLSDSGPYEELMPVVASGPLQTSVVVSGGHDIGEMGRWLGCDFALAGEEATISCGDLRTRSKARMTMHCDGSESTFVFERAEPLEGEVEIRVQCERGFDDSPTDGS